jgi:integrase
MVLSMSRPWQHPTTKVWYFRKAVPAKLRPLLQKREEKVSLHTKDWVEAKRLHARKSVEVDNLWARLGAGLPPINTAVPISLSPKAIVALAGEFYRDHLGANDEDPGSADWQSEIRKYETIRNLPLVSFHLPRTIEHEYGEKAKAFLALKGYVLDQSTYRMFLFEFAKAFTDANQQLVRNTKGDFTPDPKAARFPKFKDKNDKVLLWPAWEKYSARLKPATRKRWRPIMTRLEDRFGDDLTKLTFDGLLALRDDRLKDWKPKTVREGDIAAIRWLLQRLVKDRKLPRNVAAEIEVLDNKNEPAKQKGFRPEEARKILAAAIAPPSKPMTVENAAARRWIPWLCAYTGARLNEITQARAQDVSGKLHPKLNTTIWILHITPEAGTVKTSEDRDVPLHPHLIEQGFIEYVKSRSGLPLFYDPARARKKSDENPYYKKVGDRLREWIRDQVGITEKSVQPNHGWRHLFKTIGRSIKMNDDVLDMIQGHKTRREAQEYGETWSEVAYDEICKIPWYEIDCAELSSPESLVSRRLTRRRVRAKGRAKARRKETGGVKAA